MAAVDPICAAAAMSVSSVEPPCNADRLSFRSGNVNTYSTNRQKLHAAPRQQSAGLDPASGRDRRQGVDWWQDSAGFDLSDETPRSPNPFGHLLLGHTGLDARGLDAGRDQSSRPFALFVDRQDIVV